MFVVVIFHLFYVLVKICVVFVVELNVNVVKVKLAILVECDPKAPFSIATTQRCRGGRYSFLWIAPFYRRNVPYIAEC